MTGSSGSSPSSPNTKPEPRYHQRCCQTNSGLSGPSSASVPLPMPDSKQDLQTTWWNDAKFKYKKSQRFLPHSSHTSSDTHISYGLQWNEKNKRKFTQIWMIDLAHLSTNPLCSLPFTHFTISPSTSSVWSLDPYFLTSPLMTDFSGSSPSSPNTKPEPLYNQFCCFANSGLSGSSSASVPLPMPDRKQRCAKYVVKSS